MPSSAARSRSFLLRALLAAGLACTGATANAAPEILHFDPQQSHAEFDVRVVWLFAVEGRFESVEGEVRIDRGAQTARVSAEIDMRSLQMHSESNTTWAKSDEFFDVARYPHTHFVSKPFPLAMLQTGGPLPGSLTVRGHTAPTTFVLQPSNCADRSLATCQVQADGSLRRSDFGMRSRRGTLSDRVRLRLAVTIQRTPEP